MAFPVASYGHHPSTLDPKCARVILAFPVASYGHHHTRCQVCPCHHPSIQCFNKCTGTTTYSLGFIRVSPIAPCVRCVSTFTPLSLLIGSDSNPQHMFSFSKLSNTFTKFRSYTGLCNPQEPITKIASTWHTSQHGMVIPLFY
jgi:hypothetical protein